MGGALDVVDVRDHEKGVLRKECEWTKYWFSGGARGIACVSGIASSRLIVTKRANQVL